MSFFLVLIFLVLIKILLIVCFLDKIIGFIEWLDGNVIL